MGQIYKSVFITHKKSNLILPEVSKSDLLTWKLNIKLKSVLYWFTTIQRWLQSKLLEKTTAKFGCDNGATYWIEVQMHCNRLLSTSLVTTASTVSCCISTLYSILWNTAFQQKLLNFSITPSFEMNSLSSHKFWDGVLLPWEGSGRTTEQLSRDANSAVFNKKTVQLLQKGKTYPTTTDLGRGSVL